MSCTQKYSTKCILAASCIKDRSLTHSHLIKSLKMKFNSLNFGCPTEILYCLVRPLNCYLTVKSKFHDKKSVRWDERERKRMQTLSEQDCSWATPG